MISTVERLCNVCGKEFDLWDEQERFGLHYYHIGYGSRYDGSNVRLNMCCKCFDELMDTYFIPKCIISPVEDGEVV